MQTKSVTERRQVWPRWAGFLRRYGLESIAAWLLEAAGPLTLVGAQVLYLGSPLFRSSIPNERQDDLASLLEDRDEVLAFASFLREEIES
jgi:hypothetical protein